MENLVAFSVRKAKRVAEEERENIPTKGQSQSKVKGKVIPTSFPKIEGRGWLLAQTSRERGAVCVIGR